MDSDSDYDEETQIKDLAQLTAVLEADNNDSATTESARCSVITSGPNSTTTPLKQDLDKVQKALALNKLTDEKLRRLENVLIARLKECQQRIQAIHNTAIKVDKDKTIFRYFNCGKPYFKDKNNFPAPDNEDTLTMARSGIYDFSNVMTAPGWTVKDKSDFIKEIHKMSQNLRKTQLRSKLAMLRRETKNIKTKDLDRKIEAINKQIDAVDKMPLNKLVLPLEEEYDWDHVAATLSNRHSAQEYRALWKLFLHPSINKKSWYKVEHYKLREIVKDFDNQDWDKIAKELNTGRTGYQCFVYYRANMNNTFSGQKWTQEEEEYLRRITEYYKEDEYIPWGKVAVAMENRTKIQIYNKYSRMLVQRKGRFLPEEDAVILTCDEAFGMDFKKMAMYLPGRSCSQISRRYHVLNNTTRTSCVWTPDEDKKLVQLMANQDYSFINYSALTKYFPDKDRLQIRARYVTLVKWMKRHPNKDISKAPRRGARRLGHGQRVENLNQAIESLKTRIQSEVENKKSRKLTKNSDEDVIEHAIIATLISEHKLEEEAKKPENEVLTFHDDYMNTTLTINETNIRKTLIMLKAKLNRARFAESSYFRHYPGLMQVENVPCCVKVKSYSKKAPKTIEIKGLLPDIWGGNTLKSNDYVFPPNYSTITGCRRILTYFSDKPRFDSTSPNMNMHLMLKRNGILKEQVEILLERFYALFMWPFLLSNRSPKGKANKTYKANPQYERNRELLGGAANGVAIPEVSENFVNNDIDLDSSNEEEEKIVIKTYVGNDDFMYMKD